MLFMRDISRTASEQNIVDRVNIVAIATVAILLEPDLAFEGGVGQYSQFLPLFYNQLIAMQQD